MTDVQRATEILARGGVVAIPTETVYGLAGAAERRSAVEKIYRIKGRPLDHPVIVHLGGLDWLGRWARHVPPAAERLMERFWPGPLTFVLPRASRVGDWLTGGQDTVGLRMPNHPLTLELLRSSGLALAAPSANRFGRISPTTAAHVREDLGEDVEMVLDGGPCQIGVESTIVDFSGPRPRLLRPGAVSVAQLEELAGPLEADLQAAPRAPGTLESHYAPLKPTRWLHRGEPLEGKALLAFSESRSQALAYENLGLDPQHAAHNLYAALRRLDNSAAAAIVVEPPPSGPQWEPVADRLSRAVRGS